ncbi:zinc ribbon domain-containing protein [Desulforhopalus vacuolatus]|uniref:FmdB family zinc ribbon protein n=1 Tax=Desulforhopalus vacuolatus TaxID=40414 RepID=UPI0019652AD0|nr:zinc ribbon domain-containing protein [Desulforhopalus vacuolatus]MBM9520432.1 zinc ribbon domain-containing protein [Desulforhopalus vacuolatus]
MPLYEYKCNACNKEFEYLTTSIKAAEEVKCPSCGSSDVKKLISSGVVRPGALSGLKTAGSSCGGGGGFT